MVVWTEQLSDEEGLYVGVLLCKSPRGLTFMWMGCCGLCLWHKPTERAHSFLCLYGPFNCISFNRFSQQLSAFSLCSLGLISALLVLSSIYLLMKVSLSPDIILCGWLGLKHQLTNYWVSCSSFAKRKEKSKCVSIEGSNDFREINCPQKMRKKEREREKRRHFKKTKLVFS